MSTDRRIQPPLGGGITGGIVESVRFYQLINQLLMTSMWWLHGPPFKTRKSLTNQKERYRTWRRGQSNLHTCSVNCLTNKKIAVSSFVSNRPVWTAWPVDLAVPMMS